MFRYGLVILYFSYLLMGGTSMAQGVSNAEEVHANGNAQMYQSNLCRLHGDSSQCKY